MKYVGFCSLLFGECEAGGLHNQIHQFDGGGAGHILYAYAMLCGQFAQKSD